MAQRACRPGAPGRRAAELTDTTRGSCVRRMASEYRSGRARPRHRRSRTPPEFPRRPRVGDGHGTWTQASPSLPQWWRTRLSAWPKASVSVRRPPRQAKLSIGRVVSGNAYRRVHPASSPNSRDSVGVSAATATAPWRRLRPSTGRPVLCQPGGCDVLFPGHAARSTLVHVGEPYSSVRAARGGDHGRSDADRSGGCGRIFTRGCGPVRPVPGMAGRPPRPSAACVHRNG